MKCFGSFVTFLILAINALFAGLILLAAYSPYISPVAHPVLSCMGLTFPIFTLINGCFLIFWLAIRRYRSALLPLVCFLLCYSQIRTYLPINCRTDHLPEGSIKFLSYNIMAFDGSKKIDGKNPILTYLKESGADILCLQEHIIEESPRYLTQKDVERELKAYPYHRIHKLGSVDGHNSMACYSKFPILSARLLDYASEYNGSVVYELKIGEDTITIINNHLESSKLTKEDKDIYEDILASPQKEKVKSGARLLIGKLAEASAIRAPQADTIAREIASSKHPYIIVCGDFNDTPISYAHRVIAQDLDDAFTQSGRGLGVSYNQNKFYFRIDNILISKSLRAYNCTVDRSIKDSDHYPIWCYIAKRE
ncbi:MAG: endonuclease/exonuclease/phosphatase family protein [Bacteroides sp.]|nr:endonuclease/exonuclease/phosphatase family protein [Bacteroides sp.]